MGWLCAAGYEHESASQVDRSRGCHGMWRCSASMVVGRPEDQRPARTRAMGQLRHASGRSASPSASASPNLLVSSKVAPPRRLDDGCAAGPFLRAVAGSLGTEPCVAVQGAPVPQGQKPWTCAGHRLPDTDELQQRVGPPGGFRRAALRLATTGRLIRCGCAAMRYTCLHVVCESACTAVVHWCIGVLGPWCIGAAASRQLLATIVVVGS